MEGADGEGAGDRGDGEGPRDGHGARWNARSPLLDEITADVRNERYPVSSRLAEQHAFDQLDRSDDATPYLVQDALDVFEFGLQRLLDGIEAHIDALRRHPKGKRRNQA